MTDNKKEHDSPKGTNCVRFYLIYNTNKLSAMIDWDYTFTLMAMASGWHAFS